MKKSNIIGQGYYQKGYGRGFKKLPKIRLINGKLYAKDAAASPFQTDLQGYVMINSIKNWDKESFYEVGLISDHLKY